MISSLYSIIQRKRETVLVFWSLLCGFGIYSIFQIPLELIPKNEMTYYTIETIYPSATPEMVESVVTAPLVSGLLGENGVRDLDSCSDYGVSKISLEMRESQEYVVQNRLDQVAESFPREVQSPRLKKAKSGEDSLMRISVPLEGLPILQDLEREISSLGGISSEILGRGEGKLSLEVDEKRLSVSGIYTKDLHEFLRQQVKQSPVGISMDSGKLLPIQIMGVREGGGSNPLSLLKPVLNSSITYKKKEEIQILYDGNRVNVLTLYALGKDDLREKVKIIREKLNSFKKEKGLQFTVLFDRYSERDHMLLEFLGGMCLVVFSGILIVLLFLKEGRWILPLFGILASSLLLSFSIHYLTGISLNLYSLMGISLGTGILFDLSNTIFISLISNRQKKSVLDVAQTIFKSSLYSTLTSIIVLIPLMDLPSRIGSMYGFISRSFSITLICNLLTTYLFIFVFGEYLSFVASSSSGMYSLNWGKSFTKKMIYTLFFKWKCALKESKSVLILIMATLLFLGGFSLFFISKEVYPPLFQKQIHITLHTQGKSPEDTQKKFLEMDAYLASLPSVVHRFASYHKENPEWLVDFRGGNSQEFSEEVSRGYRMGKDYLEFRSIHSFTEDTQTTTEKLLLFTKEDQEPVQKILEDLCASKAILQIYSGFSAVQDHFLPNVERFSLISLPPKRISEMSLDSSESQISYYDSNFKEEKTIQIIPKQEEDREKFKNFRNIPLGEFFKKLDVVQSPIYTKEGRNYTPFYILIDSKKILQVHKILGPYLNEGKMEWRGDSDSRKIVGDLLKSFYFSLIFLCFLLYFAYESIRKSLFILFSLLFVDSFAFLGLFLTNSTLNVGSFLGILFLSGLSVDSILLFLEKKENKTGQILKSIFQIVILNICTTVLGMGSLLILFGSKQFQSTIALSVLSGLVGLFFYYTFLLKPIYCHTFIDKDLFSSFQRKVSGGSEKWIFPFSLMIIQLILFWGLFDWVQFMPQSNSKVAEIEWKVPEGSVSLLDQKGALPLEASLKRMEGIERFETHIEYEYMRITIQFSESVSTQNLLFSLRREIQDLETHLPPYLPRFRLHTKTQESEPDFVIGLEAEGISREDLVVKIQKEILPKWKQISGVKQIQLFGEELIESRLQYDRKRLEATAFSSPELFQKISGNLDSKQISDTIYHPLSFLDTTLGSSGFTFSEGKLFSQDFLKAYSAKKTKRLIHRINAEETVGLTLTTDSFLSNVYFSCILLFGELPLGIRADLIYSSLQNLGSLFKNHLFILFVPLIVYFVLKSFQKKFCPGWFSLLYSVSISFLALLLITRSLSLSLLYGMGYSFFVTSVYLSKESLLRVPITWIPMYGILYIVVHFIPKDMRDFSLQSLFSSFLFLHFFWFFSEKFGSFKPSSYLVVRFFLSIFYKKISKIREFFSKISKWLDSLSEKLPFFRGIRSFLAPLGFFLLSVLYFVFPNLPTFFEPSQRGEVLRGVLEFPSGTPMSTTNSMSLRLESILLGGDFFDKIYAKVQNDRSQLYLYTRKDTLPDPDFWRWISSVSAPGYFYLPTESFLDRDILEINVWGNDMQTIWTSILEFQNQLKISHPEIQMVTKFKMPSQRWDLRVDPFRCMVSEIISSDLGTHFQSRSGILAREYKNGQLTDIRLEESPPSYHLQDTLADILKYKNKSVHPSYYYSPSMEEEFNVVRKINGQMVLSFLLLPALEKKQKSWFSLLSSKEAPLDSLKISESIISQMHSSYRVYFQILPKANSFSFSSLFWICLGVPFLFSALEKGSWKKKDPA
jgi:hydrophobic/amphiphilic exporter-1 (mainly G- bacteria), HAE1 family